MCATTMMVLVGGLLATRIAPSPKLATVPLAALVVGTAIMAVPAALLLRRFGRKRGSWAGYALGLLGAGLGFLGTLTDGFVLLALAGLCLGMAAAFWQQFRFAALESVADARQHGPALSLLLCGGLLAAFVGPEIGARGDAWFPGWPGYAGAFLLLGGVTLGGLVAFQFFYRETAMAVQKSGAAARHLSAIIQKPAFIIPALGGAIGFGMMTFIMHATPLTMREMCGFDLGSTKQVIQGHIVAMYLPSVFSGGLIRRYGAGRVMMAGALLYIGVVVIGLFGQELVHFWGSLLLLGVGWNFLFMGGTALLPKSYAPAERFKVQAVNDLLVFGAQALASLSSAWFVFTLGWHGLLLGCLPILLLAAALSLWQIRREES
ncbi:multidrug transporter [Cephaloticoccus primus]|uniref:Multidrug transporter n=2 Tax=Cephaloticoccus primus TaxID=1548207 RepID=A0A139SH64_9BACT|nr:multidrug transporter [Cephaloticoccus primus]